MNSHGSLSQNQTSGAPPQEGLRGPHFALPSSRPDVSAPVKPLLASRDLWKTYRKAQVEIPVLRGVDLRVPPGAFTAVVGQSGSGKSTLLHLLATLDQPDSGIVEFEGNRIDNLLPVGRDTLRNRYFGMIFQFYHLLPELTTLENVLLPSMVAKSVWQFWHHRRDLRDRARQLLELVGLEHRLKHRPTELSGGEMQRVAIARSLMAHPRLLLADEPTGNLDKKTGEDIMRLLRNLNQQQRLTIVMVTHDPSIAAQADEVVQLVEGQVKSVR